MRQTNFTTRAEIRLIARAIRRGWPTPTDQRARAVERLVAFLEDPDSSNRLVTAAARVLLLVDRSDLGLSLGRLELRTRSPRRRRGRARRPAGSAPATGPAV